MKKGPSGEECQQCYYFRKFEEYDGFCYRYPPKTANAPENWTDGKFKPEMYGFPENVSSTSWCGEYRRHPEAGVPTTEGDE